MKPSTLVFRSLRFYARTHLGVVAGCAVSAAVLVGALFVGDSVRESLRRIALARLGRVEVAMDTANRYFRDDLPERLGSGSAALRVKAMAIGDGGQVNRVETLGVDKNFFALAKNPPGIELEPDEVALNAKLAAALGTKAGEEISLRLFKPGLLSRDAPLAKDPGDDTQRKLLTVKAVLSDGQLGRFSLRSDQAAPYNAFVDRSWLQEAVEHRGWANVLVADASDRKNLEEAWTVEDAGLSVRALEAHRVLQLETPRIYLDPAVSGVALGVMPEAVGVLSYLVDEIASEEGKATPYSFVTALSPSRERRLGPVPQGMKDDEILVNRWLADRLSVGEGDRVKMTYRVQTAGNRYVEKRREFRVRGVLEMDALKAEKELVPDFPGLSGVRDCADWKIGMPLDEEKLKDKANEEYWDEYEQTPKAFVTLAAGREMWAGRYGDLMAVRYPASAITPKRLRESLRERIDPEDAGLLLRPVRVQALKAVSESMDLGQLFLGMSIFLIAASLVLTSMLFVFSVEQRAREMGVLLAMGHTPGQVRRLFLAEGGVLALAGSVAGIPLGWAFARFLIRGLSGAWSGAVADAPIEFHAGVGSAIVGAAAAAVMSLGTIALAMWRQARRPVRELVAEDYSLSLEKRAASGGGWLRKTLFAAGTLGAVAVAAATLVGGAKNPAPAFFAAGSLMLVGGIALIRMILARLSEASSAKPTVSSLGVRNASRRPGRAMATAGMLACGSFMVLSVSAFKEDLSLQAGERRSGTGGFGHYGETSIAIHEDLNGEEGRKKYFLTDAEKMEGVSFVPVKVKEGNDASCRNMNLSLDPTLLGVDPAAFATRGAFDDPKVWGLLDAELPDGAVPAIVGDAATPVWKLKMRVGPEDGALLEYTDERGEKFKVKLVAALPMRLSVFQGRLLISQTHFTRRYPSESGYRMFLVDAPAEKADRTASYLTRQLAGAGLDLVPSVDRLREFYVVESAYLMMFLVLGGMGLLLGTAGMAVLVLRNVMERRGELALLRAVGYTKRQTGAVVMAEHWFLLGAGLAAGAAASLLAIGPSALRPEVSVPFGLLAGFLIGTGALSLAWIWVTAKLALRAPLVPALRNE